MKKIKYFHRIQEKWDNQLLFHKEAYNNSKKALSFSKQSKIQKEDIIKLLKIILEFPKEKIQLSKINHQYTKLQFLDLIKRLKMLGEIYDPLIETDKKGKYIEII